MFSDGVIESSSTTGTGTYTLTGAVFSGLSFAQGFPGGGDVVYQVQTADKAKWEMVKGVLTIGPPRTLTRATILKSSNAGSAIDWQSTDVKYVFSIASADAEAGLLAGNLATLRPWWVRQGGRWWDRTPGLAVSWLDNLYNGSADIRTGLYDAVKALYFPDNRRTSTAVGAANKVFAAADVGGSFTFSTSGGARTATLPASATAKDGYALEMKGLGDANGIVLTPDAGDGIDGGADGVTKTIAGGILFTVRWNAAADMWLTSYNVPAVQVVRSYLAGLTLSAAGSTATFGIAAGVAADSTNTDMMALASAYTKTASAWVVGSGNGALDTGAIANNTWYHVWLIKRVDTNVVDVLLSTSATAPTMPASYTLKRRVGSMKTDGSAQWIGFIQDGDYFRWVNSILDVDVTNPGNFAVTRGLTVARGISVMAVLNLMNLQNTNPFATYLSDLAAADEAPSPTAAPLVSLYPGSGTQLGGTQIMVRTNTSAQIRTRCSNAGAEDAIRIATLGWIDRRGRDD
ncbi:MAG TPA: hypothetical protein VK634_11135 [Reyranella sp.]|nr:hypothetical protein [Reyranella sp.]HTE81230.1 hypothetical protein [Reyranella sp.]